MYYLLNLDPLPLVFHSRVILYNLCCHQTNIFSGKTLLCKEKAIDTDEKEDEATNRGDKPIADPVYYISLLGVDEYGFFEEDEYIFDVYTKEYDFDVTNVKVLNAQDLMEFYEQHHVDEAPKWENFKRAIKMDSKINIYQLLEYFIKHNCNGHFIIDECPILLAGSPLIIVREFWGK